MDMKNKQGFASIVMLIIAAAAVIIFGWAYVLTRQKAVVPVTPNLDAERPSETGADLSSFLDPEA